MSGGCCGPFVPEANDGDGGGGGGGGDIAISAGTQLASTGTILFANSNGLTFGLSASSQMTASMDAIRRLSAGTTNASGSGVSFANANGVTFGAAGQTITASIAAATPETPFGISAGTQSVSTGTVSFANSNGVTFGMSGSSRITASVAPETPFAISAGTQSVSTGTVSFANANGVSFGMAGSNTVTASVAAQTDYTHSQYSPHIGNILANPAVVNGSLLIHPRTAPNLAWSQQNILVWHSANVASVGSASLTHQLGVYTKNAGSLSLLMSTSMSTTVAYSLGGGSASFYGVRLITSPWTSTLSRGDYWFGVLISTTISSDNASFRHICQDMIPQGGSSLFSGMFGAGFASTHTTNMQLGFGNYSVSTAAMPASIAFSEIRGSLIDRIPTIGLGSTI